MDCREIDAALTAYVDGECLEAERAGVEGHLRACPPCRARWSTERATHELLRSRCARLRGTAPPALRQRCAAQRVSASVRRTRLSRAWVPLTVAATLIAGLGLFIALGTGSRVEAYAAQLAFDHLKCFQFPPNATRVDADGLGREWMRARGWPLRVAAPSAADQLELLGVRRCGSTQGLVAHILYRWRGQPLSVYVLNGRADIGDPHHDLSRHDHGAVRKLGEQEILWSERGRTYAVVARARLEDLQQVARYVRPRIE